MPLHWPELIIVVVIALLFFGPKRLPEIGSSIGKTIKEFQKSMKEVTEPSDTPAAVTPPAPVQQQQQIPAATTASVAQAEPPAVAEPPVAKVEPVTE